MVNSFLLALSSALLISFVSLIGVFTLSIKPKKLKGILIYLVSFAVGALFGDAFIHLIPESFSRLGINIFTSLLILFGITAFFVMEKFIYWHHCHKIDCDEYFRPVAVINLIGDGLHNLIDGLLIGASFLVSVPIGISTSLAVMAHEIPQEISDFGVLVHGGFTTKKALFFNFLSALAAIVGVMISFTIGSRLEGFEAFLIPITAGGFIYIAGSDLIPELHHGTDLKKAVKQLVAILLGIGTMILLTFLD